MSNHYFSGRLAIIYAVFVLILTVIISCLFPGQIITLGGLVLVVFISVFINRPSSTFIAVWICIATVLCFMAWNLVKLKTENREGFFYVIILIICSGFVARYIRNLIKHMQFDKSHMASLFENATEGIVLANSTGNIILANPAACRMFDYAAEELIGNKIEILLPAKYSKHHVQLRDGFYRDPSNRRMGSGRDLNGAKKDGTNFPVEVSLSSYKQDNNQYAIAFIVDITHRKEIEASMLQQQHQLEQITSDVRTLNSELEAKVGQRTVILQEALQRLEESQLELSEALDKERQLNEIKSRFVSMASHEFRTPLSAVLSSASLISKYTTSEQQEHRTKHINRIKDSVKHLNNLLEDFLSLGKLDEGKISSKITRFNLEETIAETIDELKGLARVSQEIIYTHHGNVKVSSDKSLMKNILINLISNALKFSGEDSVVAVSSEVDEQTLVIRVEDQGIGISEEDQHHLFSSFFRAKNAVNIQGSGLGLHIVKRYVDLLGGSIDLRSALESGTTVTIVFPLK